MHPLVIFYLHIIHLMLQKKIGFYRSKDCMQMFCKDLKEHASKIINYKKEDYVVIR